MVDGRNSIGLAIGTLELKSVCKSSVSSQLHISLTAEVRYAVSPSYIEGLPPHLAITDTHTT